MKTPYALTPAVATDQRHEQMRLALATGYPRLQPVPIDESRTLSLACYGPSLQDTWKDLRPPILSMSGATRWLADRGVIADYHVDMDPRLHKTNFIDPPIDGVQYLMASVCHPKTWDLLKDQKVILWHPVSDIVKTYEWVHKHDPGQLIVHGGSTIGLSALHIGGLLGYRHFEIHGMDGSFSGVERHAGMHSGKAQKGDITWDAGGVTYRTSKVMANAVSETINAMAIFPIFCVFHGTGLTQALIREAGLANACCADETDKAAKIRRAAVRILVQGFNLKDKTALAFGQLRAAGEADRESLASAYDDAELRRTSATYNTGSISLEAMVLLRGLVTLATPKIVAEVGTFIGRSTTALCGSSVEALYTCDRSNDVFPYTSRVVRHPRTSSTEMFSRMLLLGERVDVFFFDGRLGVQDIPLILRLSKPSTTFVFDDYVDQEKGVANVKLLQPFLPEHVLLHGHARLAFLLPTKT